MDAARLAASVPSAEWGIVIAFVAITAVINIALGYALAAYLGRAKARHEASAEQSGLTLTLPTRQLATQEAPAGPALAPAPAPAVRHESPAPATAATLEPPQVEATTPSIADAIVATMDENAAAIPAGGASAAASEPLAEQELLAGIEEFRSQLAQLKGAAGAGAKATPTAAAPTA